MKGSASGNWCQPQICDAQRVCSQPKHFQHWKLCREYCKDRTGASRYGSEKCLYHDEQAYSGNQFSGRLFQVAVTKIKCARGVRRALQSLMILYQDHAGLGLAATAIGQR